MKQIIETHENVVEKSFVNPFGTIVLNDVYDMTNRTESTWNFSVDLWRKRKEEDPDFMYWDGDKAVLKLHPYSWYQIKSKQVIYLVD